MREMELRDTIKMMDNIDFKERFRAEYFQLKIRYEKLYKMVTKMEAGTLEFKPTCTIEDFKDQLKYMSGYLYRLEVRAQKEKISLLEPGKWLD